MEAILNRELEMTYPEGFHELTEEERSRLTFIEEGQCLCLSDPERHIMVSIGWKQPGMLATLLLSTGDIAKNMEKSIGKAMREMDYCREDDVKTQIAGAGALGYRYRYRAQGVDMAAESDAVKIGKTIYYFNFYAREALRDESFPVWEKMLKSVRKM